ncbi:MAG: molybdopterin-dependent oxidoreductase [Rhizobiales bacterium]|nr:molybdopterin-dependent oxidoreductase [Hyphomicrobiales bacterium]
MTADDVGIGAPLPRYEDLRLVRGAGRYTDDHHFPGEAHLVVMRSTRAAARVVSIDAAGARSVPGVLAVLTGPDSVADGLGLINCGVERKLADGSPMPRPPYHVLAVDEVRFVGDAVVAVVADTLYAAQEAADLVVVEYEDKSCITTAAEAAKAEAPRIWPQHAPDNVCYVVRNGNVKAVDEAFARAAHVVRTDHRVTRVSTNAMEPRNAVGLYDPVEDRYTLHAGTQVPHRIRNEIAEHVLHIPIHKLRVVSLDVGGGFGMKGAHYPEYMLCLWASRKVGRPVRWTATRSESFLSDYHGRDSHWLVELALDKDGIFLGLRAKVLANVGAYLGLSTTLPPANNIGGIAGVYRTPAICSEVTAYFTNTGPMSPYRGAGRPEATLAIEQIIDVAADTLGIEPVEIRRRNLIPPDAMPYKTGLVFTYDCGEFEKNMDLAIEAADWNGFAKRRQESETNGKLRGLSVVNAIEVAAGPFGRPSEEYAEMRFDPGGNLTVLLGTHNHGQGHETAFRQMAHTLLGLDPERVRVLWGDTDLVAHGVGTFGSRSMIVGGTSMKVASDKIIERGRMVASHMLEAAAADIVFDKGSFKVTGTDRQVRIEDVAKLSYRPHGLPVGEEVGLWASAMIAPDNITYPNGCHVCEVEVDPETGKVDVVRYVVVDDVGTMVNPMLVKGQIHGGIAQGLGQVLMESIEYDAGGQMVTASYMDYGMPRAHDFPYLDIHSNSVPTATNVFGVKGVGEAGTVGAVPAVLNAIVDALKPLGVTQLDMPATPARVWQAIQAAKASCPGQVQRA